jgi:hypothetical protein
MGAVWLARDIVLDRTVAVKQLGVTTGGEGLDLERAEREAHLAASVTHQNVVAVYDLVHDGETQWLVMEHVDGPTLAALVADRGSIPADELLPVLEQVADALSAAHEHGIVHRDVKPSNILLAGDGAAKLSDFGVARAQADASLTQTGLVTGSPAYLSPEVATGRTATAASDVWSLGAAMFHAMAGHPPYEAGDNVLGAMYRIVNEEPPRLDGAGTLPALVAAMMQHDPDARPTMAQVRDVAAGRDTARDVDVDTQLITPSGPAPEPTPTTAFRPLGGPVGRRRGPTDHRTAWLAGIVAAAVLLVVVIGTAVGGRGSVDPDGTVATDDPTPSANATPADTEPSPAADSMSEAEALEGFATDYLTAAANDPRAGFEMLTTTYQRESGGFEGYNGFWSHVSDLNVTAVQGDADEQTVSYTYSYDYDGQRRTEDVVLQLKQQGDTFLIDGAT